MPVNEDLRNAGILPGEYGIDFRTPEDMRTKQELNGLQKGATNYSQYTKLREAANILSEELNAWGERGPEDIRKEQATKIGLQYGKRGPQTPELRAEAKSRVDAIMQKLKQEKQDRFDKLSMYLGQSSAYLPPEMSAEEITQAKERERIAVSKGGGKMLTEDEARAVALSEEQHVGNVGARLAAWQKMTPDQRMAEEDKREATIAQLMKTPYFGYLPSDTSTEGLPLGIRAARGLGHKVADIVATPSATLQGAMAGYYREREQQARAGRDITKGIRSVDDLVGELKAAGAGYVEGVKTMGRGYLGNLPFLGVRDLEWTGRDSLAGFDTEQKNRLAREARLEAEVWQRNEEAEGRLRDSKSVHLRAAQLYHEKMTKLAGADEHGTWRAALAKNPIATDIASGMIGDILAGAAAPTLGKVAMKAGQVARKIPSVNKAYETALKAGRAAGLAPDVDLALHRVEPELAETSKTIRDTAKHQAAKLVDEKLAATVIDTEESLAKLDPNTPILRATPDLEVQTANAATRQETVGSMGSEALFRIGNRLADHQISLEDLHPAVREIMEPYMAEVQRYTEGPLAEMNLLNVRRRVGPARQQARTMPQLPEYEGGTLSPNELRPLERADDPKLYARSPEEQAAAADAERAALERAQELQGNMSQGLASAREEQDAAYSLMNKRAGAALSDMGEAVEPEMTDRLTRMAAEDDKLMAMSRTPGKRLDPLQQERTLELTPSVEAAKPTAETALSGFVVPERGARRLDTDVGSPLQGNITGPQRRAKVRAQWDAEKQRAIEAQGLSPGDKYIAQTSRYNYAMPFAQERRLEQTLPEESAYLAAKNRRKAQTGHEMARGLPGTAEKFGEPSARVQWASYMNKMASYGAAALEIKEMTKELSGREYIKVVSNRTAPHKLPKDLVPLDNDTTNRILPLMADETGRLPFLPTRAINALKDTTLYVPPFWKERLDVLLPKKGTPSDLDVAMADSLMAELGHTWRQVNRAWHAGGTVASNILPIQYLATQSIAGALLTAATIGPAATLRGTTVRNWAIAAAAVAGGDPAEMTKAVKGITRPGGAPVTMGEVFATLERPGYLGESRYITGEHLAGGELGRRGAAGGRTNIEKAVGGVGTVIKKATDVALLPSKIPLPKSVGGSVGGATRLFDEMQRVVTFLDGVGPTWTPETVARGLSQVRKWAHINTRGGSGLRKALQNSVPFMSFTSYIVPTAIKATVQKPYYMDLTHRMLELGNEVLGDRESEFQERASGPGGEPQDTVRFMQAAPRALQPTKKQLEAAGKPVDTRLTARLPFAEEALSSESSVPAARGFLPIIAGAASMAVGYNLATGEKLSSLDDEAYQEAFRSVIPSLGQNVMHSVSVIKGLLTETEREQAMDALREAIGMKVEEGRGKDALPLAFMYAAIKWLTPMRYRQTSRQKNIESKSYQMGDYLRDVAKATK